MQWPAHGRTGRILHYPAGALSWGADAQGFCQPARGFRPAGDSAAHSGKRAGRNRRPPRPAQCAVRGRLPRTAGLRRPRDRQRHGQVGPHRRKNRRHAGQHRHAGVFSASGRGRARRSGHDHAPRPAAGAVEFRRDRRDPAADPARQAPGRAADRAHRPAGVLARASRRHRTRCQRRAGSLPAQSGAHHQHHRRARDGRCARGCGARSARLLGRRVRAPPPRRSAGTAAAAARREHHAHRNGACHA